MQVLENGIVVIDTIALLETMSCITMSILKSSRSLTTHAVCDAARLYHHSKWHSKLRGATYVYPATPLGVRSKNRRKRILNK